MAKRATKIFGDQIDATYVAGGLTDQLDYIEVNVDNTTLELQAVSGGNDVVAIKDLGVDTQHLADDSVTVAKIDFVSDLTVAEDGYVIIYNDTSGKLEAVDVATIIDSSAVLDDDIITGEIPTGTINAINTVFTIANTPITGTVRVYLNGIRQLVGGGNDYTISGTTITFIKAPVTNSTLLVDYFIT